MKTLVGFCFSLCALLPYSNVQANSELKKDWQKIERSAQAEILDELEYLEKETLPSNTETVTYADINQRFDLSKITNPTHNAYVKKIIAVFDREVSREEIEQSEYQPRGEEEITSLFLLVGQTGEVLGSKMNKYQDGRDENGEEGDINWSASVRFDSNGEVFTDENGTPFDDLYFQWSGH